MPPDQAELEEMLQTGYRYALALGHDRHLAEDLLQEACAAITKRRGPWTKSYLMTAIRNKFIDHCRREKNVAYSELDVDMHITCEDELPVDGLEEAMAQLRPAEREMLFLSAVEDYSASEIADLTGRPRGTVLSLIHRAKEKVRHMLRGSVNRL